MIRSLTKCFSLVLLSTFLMTGCLSPLRESQPVFSPYDPVSSATSRAITQPPTKSVVRGQGPQEYFGGRPRNPMTASGQPMNGYNAAAPGMQRAVQGATYQTPVNGNPSNPVRPVQYASPETLWGNGGAAVPGASAAPGGFPGANVPPVQSPATAVPSGGLWGGGPAYPPPSTAGGVIGGGMGSPVGPPGAGGVMGLPSNLADIIVSVQEAQTGKFMVGAAVNSDAGVTGQIVIDERNFDITAFPRSINDIFSPGVFRGRGQGLRIEALPGSQVQRYMVQFTEPYLFNTRISMNLSGYLFDRRFFDWDEERLGGRFGLGYRVSPDMSLAATLRGERVEISNPRVPGVAELDAAIGKHELYSARFNLIQDTRDIPFQPTQGYYFEAGFEQTFGTFSYPRFDLDMRRYFLLAERPDGSGRHVLGFSNKVGISGEETPVFENYFAGGYSTMRGFDFRRASPQNMGVTIGGRFQVLGSAEYLFPITADDMVKGVAFVDYGTVEEDIKIESEDFRVSIGMGLRVNIPAMGAAPIALDFAVPIAREETDEIRGFSFFMGVSR